MKEKIYSIALLLSFLVVLSHQMTPHHHGDRTLDNFSNDQNPIKEHTHHEGHGHHHHGNNHHEDDSEKTNHSQNHSFPKHNHTVASDVNSFFRLTSGSVTSLKIFSFTAFNERKAISLAIKPLVYKQKLFRDKPFPINPIFQPGAIGLRAPPFVA